MFTAGCECVLFVEVVSTEEHGEGVCVCVCVLLPGETPEHKAKSAVRVKADGELARGVQLTLQLYGTTQSADRRVRDLKQPVRHSDHQGL